MGGHLERDTWRRTAWFLCDAGGASWKQGRLWMSKLYGGCLGALDM